MGISTKAPIKATHVPSLRYKSNQRGVFNTMKRIQLHKNFTSESGV